MGKMISQARINRKDKNDSFSGVSALSGSQLPGVTVQAIPIKGGEFSGRARRERRVMDGMTKLNGRVGNPRSLNATDPHPLRTLRPLDISPKAEWVIAQHTDDAEFLDGIYETGSKSK